MPCSKALAAYTFKPTKLVLFTAVLWNPSQGESKTAKGGSRTCPGGEPIPLVTVVIPVVSVSVLLVVVVVILPIPVVLSVIVSVSVVLIISTVESFIVTSVSIIEITVAHSLGLGFGSAGFSCCGCSGGLYASQRGAVASLLPPCI